MLVKNYTKKDSNLILKLYKYLFMKLYIIKYINISLVIKLSTKFSNYVNTKFIINLTLSISTFLHRVD